MTMNLQSKECDNSTVEGGDLHTVQSEPPSGRELTNRLVEYRIWQDGRQTEVKSLFYVV
jgi:hypothetical protein